MHVARASLLGLAVGDAFGTMLDGAVWVAVRHLDSYEEALWTATAHPGLDLASNALANFAVDRDTGGIVACATGVDGIPILWREATEALPI